MNTKSVRFRLTALYSSTLIFSLVILFASFYWVTKRELYNHTDVALRSHGERLINILTEEKLLIDTQMSSQLLTEAFNETPGMLAFVTDNQGSVLTISQRTSDIDDIAAALFSKTKTLKTSIFVNQSVGSVGMRFILIPIIVNESLRDVIMIGHPIDVIDNSLVSLYGSLIVVFLSFVIPTVFGGYVLAGSALAPVGEISKEMAVISSENLKRRVRVPHTDDEIEELAHTFNGLLDRIEDAFTRERQFIGDIAHELKTPLATLKSGIDIAISKKRSQSEYKKVLDELLIDANRLSGTLTHILDLAWSRADTYETIKDSVNISKVMKEVMEIAQKLSYGKNVVILAHIEDGLMIRGKKDKVFRAILNVVENAIKFSKEKSTITVTIRKKSEHVLLSVKDTGRGIAKADLPHIFDRFYRGLATDKTIGSGLGLAITKAVITSCGGSIDIKSAVGKGTSVTIIFPLDITTS